MSDRESDRPANGWHDFVRDDAVHFLQSVKLVDAFGVNSRESYAEMDWGVELILAARGKTAHPPYFLALIKGFQMVGQLGVEQCLTIRGDGEGFSDGPDRKRRAMFVGVPHRVQSHKPLREREVVSVVRLAPFQSLEELRGQSLECWKGFAQEAHRVIVDRKLESPITDVRGNNAPHEIVEASAQVVDALSRDESEIGIGVLANVHLEDIALALGVEVRRGAIRIATEKLGFLGLEVVEMNLCSLKPPNRPVYWVRG